MAVHVVVNPRAGGGAAEQRMARLLGGVRRDPARVVHVPRDLAALEALAPTLAHATLLVVAGGDGTLGAVVSALARAGSTAGAGAPAALPPLALVPVGTMGTVARALGARSTPRALDAALAWARAGADPSRLRRAPSLRIDHDAGRSVGFLVALGVVARWFAHYERTPGGARPAAALVARAAASALAGGAFAREVFAPTRATLAVDGVAQGTRALTLFVAGTVSHVGLGLRPLPGAEAAGDAGGFAYAASDASGPVLARALPRVLAGAGLGAAVGGGHEGTARALELALPGGAGFVLDGDLRTTTRLALAPGPCVRLAPGE